MKRAIQFVIVTAALAIGSAPHAQSVPRTSSGSKIDRRAPLPPPPPDTLTVLYDQTSNAGASDVTSQNFEPAFDVYDDQAADDFVVPGGHTWSIQEVFVDGEYNTGPASSVNVIFYTDSASLPGAAQCTFNNVATFIDVLADFTITLPAPCVLGAGTYWVSVQANQNFSPNGQWFWHTRTVQSNSGAAWRNPGGGFGVGCTSWGRRGATCTLSPAEPDQIYRLSGTDQINSILNGWTTVANYPGGPIEAPAVGTDGFYVYSAAGYAGAASAALYRYDPSTNFWATKASMPVALYATRGVYAANTNKFYVFGGYNGSVLNTTYIYDVAGNSWTTGAVMPAGRYFPNMVYDANTGKIFVIGGFDGSFNEASQTWEYDPVGNTWSTSRANIPVAMAGSATTIVGRFIYLVGSWSGGTASTLHYRYDITNNAWATRAAAPAAVYEAAAGAIGGETYLIGGGNPSSPQNSASSPPGMTGLHSPATSYTSTYIYSIAGNSWTTGPTTNVAHSFTAGTAVGNQLLVVGGYNGSVDTNTVESATRQTGSGTNPFINGRFTSGGLSPWVVNGVNSIPTISSAQVHSDVFSAHLGTVSGAEPLGDSSVYQTISVPAAGGTLFYWYRPGTTDTISFDWQDAYVTNTSGTILATIMHVCSNTQAWTRVTYNMNAFAGQTVRIKFLVHQDGFGDDTDMYVDDVSLAPPPFADLDQDNKTDFTVFRPSNGVWYSALSGGGATFTGWGTAGDVDVIGDFDGDKKPDIAVWRPSTGVWFIVQSSNGAVRVVVWGASGDMPLAGDVDGDGKDDLVIYRPSNGTWYFYKSSGGTSALGWGISGDIPLLGDFDGDGKMDPTVFRSSNGVWYSALSGGGTAIVGWGVSGDIPVIGDFDGDGRSDQTIFRPSTGVWFVNKSTGGTLVVGWGVSGDTPVSGDWDGDGRSDFTVWRGSTGVWFIQYAGGGGAVLGWGVAGDKPSGRQRGS